jgi:formylglycine-generating enzyme required for sulfatase activity
VAPSARSVEASLAGVPLRFIALPAGPFRMGCSTGDTECKDDEKSLQVVVDPFQIGATEVTQELWQSVMGKNPSDFQGAKRPVENVSWRDAQDFVERLNQLRDGFTYRLPTEAEWEYAARAGETGSPDPSPVAWFGLAASSGRASRPQDVATKKSNAWGLYDMLGNVAEWCEDWYATNYQRVVRGGAWDDSAPSVRVSARAGAVPTTTTYAIGLRLVREPQ